MRIWGPTFFLAPSDMRMIAKKNNYNRDEEEQEQGEFSNLVARMIQKQHHEATAVSPVSLVAAVVLFGRTSGGITMGKLLSAYISR